MRQKLREGKKSMKVRTDESVDASSSNCDGLQCLTQWAKQLYSTGLHLKHRFFRTGTLLLLSPLKTFDYSMVGVTEKEAEAPLNQL